MESQPPLTGVVVPSSQEKPLLEQKMRQFVPSPSMLTSSSHPLERERERTARTRFTTQKKTVKRSIWNVELVCGAPLIPC